MTERKDSMTNTMTEIENIYSREIQDCDKNNNNDDRKQI